MNDDRWPDRDVLLPDAVIGYLRFVYVTFLQKLDGLTETQARAAMLSTSTAMSPLGLVKHVTAVWRQHIQIHIGGQDLPELWSHEDTTTDFRIGPDESIATITAAFTAEWERSVETLTRIDLDDMIVAYGNATRAGRSSSTCCRNVPATSVTWIFSASSSTAAPANNYWCFRFCFAAHWRWFQRL